MESELDAFGAAGKSVVGGAVERFLAPTFAQAFEGKG
jgi:hypothetical protein